MVARVKTVAFAGVETTEVDVQVQIAPGLPAFTVVGLPDKAVAESRERVRAAIHALGLSLPPKKIIVNLAPADLIKEGSHFDLPIALAVLVAMHVLTQEDVEHYVALGELALDGALLPVSGILPAAIGANAAGCGIICPHVCGSEALWAGDIDVLAPKTLLALINHFKGTQVLSPPEKSLDEAKRQLPDMKDIRGQETARRALEVAAAGGHNLLLIGPPGAGKSLLASCMPGILPPMSAEEMLEVSTIASVAGMISDGRLSRHRPYREPHHSTSLPAMVGGGKRATPGEISLAHNGVLFLDELPEFPRAVLESLRQPLESGKITVARVNSHVTYPANVQFIAAMNPCRCGYLDDAGRACGKAPRCAVDYQSRISGPLLDRIDLTLEVPALDTLDMLGRDQGEPSAAIAQRVAKARAIQTERFKALNVPFRTNADVTGELLQHFAPQKADAKALLEQATESFRLSMRGYTRTLRVARTIADLDGSEHIEKQHIAEAVSYRQAPLNQKERYEQHSA
ncbi:MAG TPA: YifB family Mg chelatase-like AAA ATPase [Rickettsiales bacterium]|nr:YifB family Mg chelatase-like AAA ATPase [Rickettsiales bacterium]